MKQNMRERENPENKRMSRNLRCDRFCARWKCQLCSCESTKSSNNNQLHNKCTVVHRKDNKVLCEFQNTKRGVLYWQPQDPNGISKWTGGSPKPAKGLLVHWMPATQSNCQRYLPWNLNVPTQHRKLIEFWGEQCQIWKGILKVMAEERLDGVEQSGPY